MKQMKKSLLVLILLSLSPVSFANDKAFEDALQKANRGDTSAAIQELQAIAARNPGDARVHRSLGLLYQSTDQIDNAISSLERAVSLSPSAESLYALGLLYESKYFSTRGSDWLSKAKNSWTQFLSVAPPSHPRRSVGQKHLDTLNNEIK